MGASLAPGRSDLVLIAGLGGDTLTFLLWTVACLCGIVLGIAGFRLFVIGYEAFTAAMALLFLCAFVLVMTVGALFAGLLTLLSAESHYFVLDELDRPAGQQIVVRESFAVHDIHWRVYQGGPVRYEEITDSLGTGPDCRWPSASRGSTPFADGDYTLTTDARGRDVLSFTVEHPNCDTGGTFELVLP